MMPGMDGMTVLRKIHENFPGTYVIMFTGKGSEEVAVELMKGGASDYILKPFSNHDLLDRIENTLLIRRIEIHNSELIAEREKLLLEIERWNEELEQRVEEKTRELELAHAEIVQSEKIATLGHISAGLAHEIRNPLNSINLFAQVLKTSLQEGDPDKAIYAEKIMKDVDRIDGLLVKLLAASKRPRHELEPVFLDALIERVLDSFCEEMKTLKVLLKKDFSVVPPPILADSTELEQIFTNLVSNAIQAMKDGGELGIRLFADDKSAIVAVSDTGEGIPLENVNKIFDPFFTTKTSGTGFGLSVVLRIVKTYGGKIGVDSIVGEGTTFNVSLPLN